MPESLSCFIRDSLQSATARTGLFAPLGGAEEHLKLAEGDRPAALMAVARGHMAPRHDIYPAKTEKAKNTPATSPQPSAAKSVRANSIRERPSTPGPSDQPEHRHDGAGRPPRAFAYPVLSQTASMLWPSGSSTNAP